MMDEKYLNELKLYKLLPTVLAMAKMSGDEDTHEILSSLKNRRIIYSMTRLIKQTQRFYKAADSSFSSLEIREELYIATAVVDSIISKKRRDRRGGIAGMTHYLYYQLANKYKWKKDRLFTLPDKKYREYL